MPPSGVDYASEFLNGYAPEYVRNATSICKYILKTNKFIWHFDMPTFSVKDFRNNNDYQ